jgi:hypothetical protein
MGVVELRKKCEGGEWWWTRSDSVMVRVVANLL